MKPKFKTIITVSVVTLLIAGLTLKTFTDWQWRTAFEKNLNAFDLKLTIGIKQLSTASKEKAQFVRAFANERRWDISGIKTDLLIMDNPHNESSSGRTEWNLATNNVGQFIAEQAINEIKAKKPQSALPPWLKILEEHDQKLEKTIVAYEKMIFERNSFLEQEIRGTRIFKAKKPTIFPSNPIYQQTINRQQLAGR